MVLSAYRKQGIVRNCTTLTFVCIGFWIFLFWIGLASDRKFTTTAYGLLYCSQEFTLFLLTHWSAGSTAHYSSPLFLWSFEADSRNSLHCSMNCCCHNTQWPCPSLQVNVFTDRYLQFSVDSVRRCARYIEVRTATINYYHLTDKRYVLTENNSRITEGKR